MRVFAEMTCCKPGRQQVGLSCNAGWLACCLARHCAKLPELADRRAFAAQVAKVNLVNKASLQEWFRNEVVRQYELRKGAA